MRNPLLCFLLVLIAVISAQAQSTYYVSALQGNDNNDGSEATPFATITKSVSAAEPGDTVKILPGTYQGDMPNNPWDEILIFKSGSPGNYITFRGVSDEQGNLPKILCGSVAAITINNQSYITIENLEFLPNEEDVKDLINTPNSAFGRSEDDPPYGPLAWVARKAFNIVRSHHIVVRDTYIHDFPGNGIGIGGSDVVLVEDNLIEHCAYQNIDGNSGISTYRLRLQDVPNFPEYPDHRVVIRGNTSRYNVNLRAFTGPNGTGTISDGNGIIIDDHNDTQKDVADDRVPYNGRTLVVDNVCYGNGGYGINIFSSDFVDVYNNTVYDNRHSARIPNPAIEVGEQEAQVQVGGGRYQDSNGETINVEVNDVRFVNNILVNTTDDPKTSFSFLLGEGIVFNNNIHWNTTGTLEGISDSDIVADPQFADAVPLTQEQTNLLATTTNPFNFDSPSSQLRTPTQNNGFPVQNLRVQAGSPAVDAGADLGFREAVGSGIDIGAFEGESTDNPEPEGPEETTSISPTNENLQYTGRIDFTDPDAPKMFYGGSSITTRFEGTSLKARFSENSWFDSQRVGFIIDGGEMIVREIANGADNVTVDVASGLENTTHDLTIVKRESPADDNLIFLGLELDEGAGLSAPDARPSRRMELYGDSVTEGVNADNTVNEEGGGDAHNAWNSYGMILARRLNAECHNQALSGLAVQDGTGTWNSAVGGIGLVSTYDQINANSGRQTDWDFSRYTPHLVVMAMGINDHSFVDESNKESWKDSYKSVINNLRNQYPEADFVLTVPPLGIEYVQIESYVAEIVEELADPDIHYFDLTVAVPPVHPAAVTHEAMADQLEAYVNTLDINWGEEGTPEPPVEEEVIQITSPTDGATFSQEASITLRAEVADPANVAKVEFFRNETIKLGDANDQYAFTWYNIAVGEQRFTARLTDNQGNVTTSEVVTVTVGEDPSGDGSGGQIVIRAKGSTGSELMHLQVDDQLVESWENVSTTATDYTYEGYSGGEVYVVFDNDGNDASGADRNLLVDYITVCGQEQQAEQAIRTTDCGNTTDGFVWLWCNSSLSFGDVGCVSSATVGQGGSAGWPAQRSAVQVYPNPARGRIVVQGPERYDVTLYDLYGKPVQAQTQQSGTSQLNVVGVRPGVYLLRVLDTQTQQTYQQKAIIE